MIILQSGQELPISELPLEHLYILKFMLYLPVLCSIIHLEKLEFVDIKASVFRSRFHKRSY